MKNNILFVDTETGGLSPQENSLLSVGLVYYEEGVIKDQLEIKIIGDATKCTEFALNLNKIDLISHNKEAISPENAVCKIEQFIEKYYSTENKAILGGHNITFDVSFLKKLFSTTGNNYSKFIQHRYVDTHSLLYFLHDCNIIPKLPSSEDAFNHFGIKVQGRHTALGDAIATAELYKTLKDLI